MPTEKTIALAPPGVPHRREEQMVAGEEAAFERPRDLRAAQALATAHRHLDDPVPAPNRLDQDRKSTRLNSSHSQISYAVFCLKKKKTSPLKHTQYLYQHLLTLTMHTFTIPATLQS